MLNPQEYEPYTPHESVTATPKETFEDLKRRFQESLAYTAENPDHYQDLQKLLKEFNQDYQYVQYDAENVTADILANVVAAIYAPFIHAFASTILDNIVEGILPDTIIAPPRDAIPLATSVQKLAELRGMKVTILQPPLNRIVMGIANNVLDSEPQADPLLPQLLEQTVADISTPAVVEMETGIYGTISLLIAQAFQASSKDYIPLKFYGLGPNLSFVHAVLSDGQSWIAEEAESIYGVDAQQVLSLMALLDSMEELGMENFYQSIDQLTLDNTGRVVGVIKPPVRIDTDEEDTVAPQIASATNNAIAETAEQYMNLNASDVRRMLAGVPGLIEQSKLGYPITLPGAIPPMDSKEEHYQKIRESQAFNYPSLKIMQGTK